MQDHLSVFKQAAETMACEWNKSEHPVTCEFSTGEDDLVEKYRILKSLSVENAHWMMCVCGVCIDHDPTTPVHVKIVRNQG